MKTVEFFKEKNDFLDALNEGAFVPVLNNVRVFTSWKVFSQAASIWSSGDTLNSIVCAQIKRDINLIKDFIPNNEPNTVL